MQLKFEFAEVYIAFMMPISPTEQILTIEEATSPIGTQSGRRVIDRLAFSRR